MESFEDFGVKPELVEALIGEGIERPTALQNEAVPTLRRGNSALVRAGAGAGVLVAYGTALLDRLEPGGGSPRAIILVPDRDHASRCARALARLGLSTGHRVAALAGPFALPGHADIVFSTPRDLLTATRSAEIKLELVEAWVLDGAAALLDDAGTRPIIPQIMEILPKGIQGVVIAEPVTGPVREFVEGHLPRAIHVPSDAAASADVGGAPIERGTLKLRASEGEPSAELAALVGQLLESGDVRHVLLFFRGEDQAADGGDLLGLHGYLAGAPGEGDYPVWLAVDALEARRALDAASESAPVAVVSVGAPSDVDELDRRHGGARAGGVVLAPGRQLPHLRRIAGEAGYVVEFLSPTTDEAGRASARMHERISEAVEEADLAPYHVLLEPAVREFGSPQVSAALAWLLRRNPATESGRAGKPADSGSPGEAGAVGTPSAFMRLFISIGTKDGVGPGDLLGAITGESGIEGDQVGRIDVKDTFSRVEVAESVAARVIEALNGITVRGRSVRADYDRTTGRSSGPEGAGPPRRGKPGGPSGGSAGGSGGSGGSRPPKRGPGRG
jgi:ATP-dependent RNA helicase DeaD